MRKGRQSKGKEIRPTFFVFCEGETEETYVKFLRSQYRVPVEIDAKIAGNRITAKYISNYKQQKITHPKDTTFLIYDCDVQVIVDKLQKINKVNLLLSNPCFELWYLLHFQEQKAELTTDECVKKLSTHIPNYVKGSFDKILETKIIKNKETAIVRARKIVELKNPSTNVYVFVEELDKIKEK
ncbi:MAG: RloB family protein [Prevotellaceae bacterium]|jgi:hypothetical protein|nr:RloB family protein [Prevotellaceae bacterium]